MCQSKSLSRISVRVVEAFQVQFAALQAELQATKKLTQAARHSGGGGDNLVSPLPRSMRLDVPKFSGADSNSWILSINVYFTLLNTTVDQRLRMVGFSLEGDAAEWYRWMTRNNLITTWDGFLESVRNRFGPCKYEDPQWAVSKLLQIGTVAQYQSKFEKLMNRVTDIFEGLLLSFYISGPKTTLQRELLVSKPTSLGDGFYLTRVMKARWDDQGVTATTSKSTTTKYTINTEQEDAMESGDILILNSLVGHGNPRSLQLWGTLGAGKVHMLIDNGSTHNFVELGVVERMQFSIKV
ncbi:ty3-gypsy retrotransposon protein [Tanacetum coccineum]